MSELIDTLDQATRQINDAHARFMAEMNKVYTDMKKPAKKGKPAKKKAKAKKSKR